MFSLAKYGIPRIKYLQHSQSPGRKLLVSIIDVPDNHCEKIINRTRANYVRHTEIKNSISNEFKTFIGGDLIPLDG